MDHMAFHVLKGGLGRQLEFLVGTASIELYEPIIFEVNSVHHFILLRQIA